MPHATRWGSIASCCCRHGFRRIARTQPAASAFHRFAMTALAVNGIDGLEASDAELTAPGTSYTADTLDRFHAAGLRAVADFLHSRALTRSQKSRPGTATRRCSTWPTSWWSRGQATTRRGSSRAFRPLAAALARPGAIDGSGRFGTRIFLVSADDAGRVVDRHPTTPASLDVDRRTGRRGVEQHIRQHALYRDGGSSTYITHRGRSLAWPKLNDERPPAAGNV